MTALVWVGVLLAGGLGAVLRFLVDGAVNRVVRTGLPAGTLVVNVSGALVLGLLDGVVLPSELALLVGTGLVGSYTTFSTWMFETQRLVEERQAARALQNLVVSVAVGLAAAWLGLWLGGLA
ncbi:MAG: fluoride efflux transporter CrcB [Marmoricola sp.]